MNVVDLFSGAGGFSTAALQAGLDVIFAANHWKLAVTVHQANHPTVPMAPMKLMTDTDWSQIPKMELLIASPSCQGFSTAATRYGGGKRGNLPKHDDDRVTSMAVIECVDRHRPKAVIIENVAEILEWGLYPWWKEGFARMGYSVSENVLNAADTGVPQERERVFIVAVKGKKKVVVPPARKEHVGILGSLDLDAGEWDFVSNKPHGVQARVARARAGKFKTAPLFIVHDDSYHSGRAVTRPIGTITTKDQWRIVRKDRRGRDETRLLSVDEYRAAMGFPEDYLLPVGKNDSVRLLGNAVAPPMARYVIERVVRHVA